jgi:hypothetical protein
MNITHAFSEVQEMQTDTDYQSYQEKPSFATSVQGVYCILYLDRYMFRPSLAIIRRNT